MKAGYHNRSFCLQSELGYWHLVRAPLNIVLDVTIFEVIIRIICFKDGKTTLAVLFKEILI